MAEADTTVTEDEVVREAYDEGYAEGKADSTSWGEEVGQYMIRWLTQRGAITPPDTDPEWTAQDIIDSLNEYVAELKATLTAPPHPPKSAAGGGLRDALDGIDRRARDCADMARDRGEGGDGYEEKRLLAKRDGYAHAAELVRAALSAPPARAERPMATAPRDRPVLLKVDGRWAEGQYTGPSDGAIYAGKPSASAYNWLVGDHTEHDDALEGWAELPGFDAPPARAEEGAARGPAFIWLEPPEEIGDSERKSRRPYEQRWSGEPFESAEHDSIRYVREDLAHPKAAPTEGAAARGEHLGEHLGQKIKAFVLKWWREDMDLVTYLHELSLLGLEIKHDTLRHSAHADDYQARVGAWMDDAFAAGGADLRTRIDRYLEESFELAQSHGYDPERIAAIRDYVFSRPVGEPAQETGGVMVTLASLCHAAGIDMAVEGERELARVHRPEVRAKIMAKQASKNGLHTPLPAAPTEGESAGLREGGANENDGWEVEVQERRDAPGEWIVERIDARNGGEGGIELTLFSGVSAEDRARAYAITLRTPAATPAPAEGESAGLRERYILDEEGGTPVGIVIDLPDGSQVWTGDLADRTFALDQDAVEEFEVNEGAFLVHAAEGDHRILARIVNVETGIELAQAYAKAAHRNPAAKQEDER